MNKALTGSTRWFYEKSKESQFVNKMAKVEKQREFFLSKFSPEKLAKMNGEELLKYVFGNYGDSMMTLLMSDISYDVFGSTGNYSYTRIVFYGRDGYWKYWRNNKTNTISKSEAVEKAIEIRDQLLHCVQCIKEANLTTVSGYVALDKVLSEVYFYKYLWMMKYYQMVFPQFFPGMYCKNTIIRAMDILGIPYKNKSKIIANAGAISLFIRKCDINNIIFNEIYGHTWQWEIPQLRCEAYDENRKTVIEPAGAADLSYYKLPY